MATKLTNVVTFNIHETLPTPNNTHNSNVKLILEF